MSALAGYCELHKRWDCTLCDECGHDSTVHINAWFYDEAERRVIFDNATCWAENICLTCVRESAAAAARKEA